MFRTVRRRFLSMLAAVALVVAGGVSIGAPAAHAAQRFKDVPANHPFAADISWLADRGIASGYSDGTFHPSESVTRAAYAAFLYRIAGKPSFSPPKASPFRDVPATHQFYKEIAWLASVGVTTGWDVRGGKEFRPDAKIARDAMAAFMYRYACSPGYTPPTVSPFRDVPATRAFYKEIAWMKATGLSNGWADGTYRPMDNTERAAIAAFLHRYADKGIASVPSCSSSRIAATPAAVVFSDPDGIGKDTFAIPSVKGVVYKIDGKEIKAGTYKVRDYAAYGTAYKATLTVSADPAAGYRLSGSATQWTHAFDGNETVVALRPDLNERTGTANDTIVIPSMPAVSYTLNGKPIGAGTHQIATVLGYGAGGSVNARVQARPKPGYRLTGTQNWNQAFDSMRVLDAAAPSFDDRNGSADDTFTIRAAQGVSYTVNGKATAPGTHKATSVAAYEGNNRKATVQISATVPAGCKFASNETNWAHSFDGSLTVTPAAPGFVDKNGMAEDTLTIPDTAGVAYYVGGRALAAGSHKTVGVAPFRNYASTVKIEARAKAGYRLHGTATWERTYSGITTLAAPAVAFKDGNGAANDTFVVPEHAGVVYSAGNKELAAGTHKVADHFTYEKYETTATVTAQARAGYKLAGTASWSRKLSGITTVTPAAVAFADKNGTENDTFSIPGGTGAQYFANGQKLATGTYKVRDYFDYAGDSYRAAAKVTAAAKSGYALAGTKAWSKSVSGIKTVTPAAVAFADKNGTGSDTITVPESEGVDYYAGEKLLKTGTHKVSSAFGYGTTYTAHAVVTARPKATYALAGTAEWAQAIDGITTVTPEAVTFSDGNGIASDTFAVPNAAGVQYKASGKNVAAGTHKVADYFAYVSHKASAAVTATAKAGYKLSGTTAWNKTLSGITAIATTAPAFADKNGKASDTVSIPNAEGAQYKIGGTNIAAGTYKVSDLAKDAQYGVAWTKHKAEVPVSVAAKDGYAIGSGDTSWNRAFDGYRYVTSQAPTFAKDTDGQANDTFTIPNVPGVQYKANGKDVAAGTHTVAETVGYGSKYWAVVKITAEAQDGCKMSGDSAWQQGYDGYLHVAAPAPTFTDPKATADDTLVIPNATGIQYKLNGENIAPGTYKAADKLTYSDGKAEAKVTAAGKAGYVLYGDKAWTYAYADAIEVDPTPPTVNDATGRDEDTVTIPSQTGVQYRIDGKDVAAGIHKVKDHATYNAGKATIKVTAVAASKDCSIKGTGLWTRHFTAVATSVAPSFNDDSGTGNDTVGIPNNEGVYYTINGRRVGAGSHPIGDYPNGMNKVEVHAYVDPAYANGLGVAIWHGTFYDGQPWTTPQPAARPIAGAYGNQSGSQAEDTVAAYRNGVLDALGSASTYAGLTTVKEIFGKNGNSADQPWSATGAYSDAVKEIQRRYEVRYHQRVNQLRSRVGLGPVLLMRLDDAQEGQLLGHVRFGLAYQSEYGVSPRGDDADLWSVVRATVNARNGMGWDGGKEMTYMVVSDHVGQTLNMTPEQMADTAIAQVLGQHAQLPNDPNWESFLTADNAGLVRLLDFKMTTHRPTVHIYDVYPSGNTMSFYTIDDMVRSNQFTGN